MLLSKGGIKVTKEQYVDIIKQRVRQIERRN